MNIAGEMQFWAPTFKLWADEYITRPEVVEARRLGAEFPTQEVVQTFYDADLMALDEARRILSYCRTVAKKGGRVHLRAILSI